MSVTWRATSSGAYRAASSCCSAATMFSIMADLPSMAEGHTLELKAKV